MVNCFSDYVNLPYSIEGGNLGLFTGMSILSMFEIIFWIVRVIAKAIRSHVNRTRRSELDTVVELTLSDQSEVLELNEN